MEAQERHVDFFACPLALERYGVLAAARSLVHFERVSGPPVSLAEWELSARK